MTDYRKRLEAELEEIGGCHDRDCKVYVTPGMHTNGGCRCLRDAYTGQRVFRAYRRAVDDQDAEITRLRAEGERMRELVADLEWRAGSVASLRAVTRTGPDFHRLQGKEAAYTHAADLARQALTGKAE